MAVSDKRTTPLGVIVDTTSFAFEDDFPSLTHLDDDEMMSLPDMDTGIIMKNGKVKRRLKWKPKNFRKKKNEISSNMSIISALSNRSGCTNKSVSTNRSMATYFSKNTRKSGKSQASFKTFHSTETQIKNNKRGPKLHYTRPNYKDTFAPKLSTIEKEGRIDTTMTAISEVKIDKTEPLPEKLSPPLTFLDAHDVSSIAILHHPQTPQKTKLPPLFKKRKSKKNDDKKKQAASLSEVDAAPPLVYLGRARTMLPTLEDHEDDRRIGMTTKEDKVSALVNQSVSPSIISDSTCASSPSRYYHRPTDSVTSKNGALVMDDGEEGTEVQNIELQDMPRAGSPRKQTVPVDLDDGGFLEPEINLRAIHDMAAEHMAHGEYEEAVEVFEEILRGQKERYGGNHYRVGTALHNLSIAYRKIENIEQAIEYCEQAVEVRKEALLPDHPDVALSLAQLGVSFLEVERIGEALVSFREALHISRNALGPKHIKCSKILNNIGCALYTNDELEESRSAFAEALDIYRYSLNHVDDTQEASKSNSHSNNLMMSMASTLCNIGSIELRYGQLDEAEIALDEALLLQQSVLPQNHPIILSTFRKLDYVHKKRDGLFNLPSVFPGWSNKHQGDATMGNILGFGAFDCGTSLHRLVSDVRPICAPNFGDGYSTSSSSSDISEDCIEGKIIRKFST